MINRILFELGSMMGGDMSKMMSSMSSSKMSSSSFSSSSSSSTTQMGSTMLGGGMQMPSLGNMGGIGSLDIEELSTAGKYIAANFIDRIEKKIILDTSRKVFY